MILLKTIMPANAHYFLKKWNDMIRWYDSSFMQSLRESYDFNSYSEETGSYSKQLMLGDYTHLFAQNMVIVIIVLLILLILWAFIAVKDRILASRSRTRRQKKCCNKRHSPWCQNFILRFCYVFFLEFCICTILQLTVQDFSEFSSSLQFCLSVVLAVAILLFLSFVLSLLCFGGPTAKDFFT